MAQKYVEIEDDKLKRALRKAVAKNPRETVKAITACVLDLSAASAEVAPIETGDLRNNCHGRVGSQTVFKGQKPTGVSPTPGTRITGSVGYSLPYALRQHEDLTLNHDRTDGRRIMTGPNAGRTVNMVAGGQAKYLEGPFLKRAPLYLERLRRIIREVTR